MTAAKIVVLGTGGTIAGTSARAGDNLAYIAAQLGVDDLLATLPAANDVALIAEQVAQIDSKDMNFAVWRDLVLRCAHWLAQADVAGLVITHGTDTVEETAFFLQAVLAPAKPVVLTCAMRPATALYPDGPQNLADAVTVASARGAQGVVLVCAGAIHGASDVAKQHTWRLDAFSSGDAGPIGYIEDSRLRLLRDWPPVQITPTQELLQAIARATTWPRVEIVTSHAGASGAVVQALMGQGVDGIVAAATGNGTLHHELLAALLEAETRGVRVLRATRCAQGRLIELSDDRLRGAGALSPVKARIALLLELLQAP